MTPKPKHTKEHKITLKLLKEAYEHLEYCGYGDSYERTLAWEDKLPTRLNEHLKAEGMIK